MNRALTYCIILLFSFSLTSCKKNKTNRHIVGEWNLIEHTRSDTSLIDFYDAFEVGGACETDSSVHTFTVKIENEFSESQQWEFNKNGTCELKVEVHDKEFWGDFYDYECGKESPVPRYYTRDTTMTFASDWIIHQDENELEILDPAATRFEIVSLDDDQMELKVLDSTDEIYMTFEKI